MSFKTVIASSRAQSRRRRDKAETGSRPVRARPSLPLAEQLSGKPQLCEHCILGKMKRLPFPTGRQRATRPLQLVHVDLCGPMKHPGPAGELYSMTLTDDYSGHPWILFLQRKSQALVMYRQWKADVEAYFKDGLCELELSPEFVVFLRSDNGGEFTSKAFEAQLAADGVRHETTSPYTPQQNGVAHEPDDRDDCHDRPH